VTRSTNNVAAKNKKKAVLKITKGFRGRSKNCLRIAREKSFKAMQYAYRDRRTKKRDFRGLWIQRINAAIRSYGNSYSWLINRLAQLKITINRKMLSEMAIHNPDAFQRLIQDIRTEEFSPQR
jgi:large subunit ribosomal protein L20